MREDAEPRIRQNLGASSVEVGNNSGFLEENEALPAYEQAIAQLE